MKRYLLSALSIFVYTILIAQTDNNEYERTNGYEKGTFINNKKKGIWEYYDNPGELALKINYDNGELLFLKKDTIPYVVKQNGHWVNAVPDKQPRYVGSMEGFYDILRSKIKYPMFWESPEKTGTAYIEFEISAKGKLNNIEIKNKVYPPLTQNLENAIKEIPDTWFAAILNNQKYSTRFSLPVIFQMSVNDQPINPEPTSVLDESELNMATQLKPLIMDFNFHSYDYYNGHNSFMTKSTTPGFRFDENKKYFFDKADLICDSAHAEKYCMYKYNDQGSDAGIKTTYNVNGTIRLVAEYSGFIKSVREGLEKEYFNDGKIMYSAEYKNGKRNGQLISYYPSGEVRRKDVFADDKFVSGNCYTVTGADTVHYDFEVIPQFVGGEIQLVKFIQNNLQYPANARVNGVEGIAYISFKVDVDGSIIYPRIVKPSDTDLSMEAMRVVMKLSKWKPGLRDGKAIVTEFNLPINFKLQ